MMAARALRWISRLAYVESRYHAGFDDFEPASTRQYVNAYHQEHHVVRRDPAEGKRLMTIAKRAARDAAAADRRTP